MKENFKQLKWWLGPLILLLLINVVGGFNFIEIAQATTCGDANNDCGLTNVWERVVGSTNVGEKEPAKIVGNLINALLVFLGAIFLILIIAGGFMWMTATGDAEKVKKARGIITNAVIGLAVVLLAYSLVQFVMTILFESIK